MAEMPRTIDFVFETEDRRVARLELEIDVKNIRRDGAHYRYEVGVKERVLTVDGERLVEDSWSLLEPVKPRFDRIPVNTPKVGDRVQYTAQFLRSTGTFTGPLPFAKGTVTEIDGEEGDSFRVATVDWGTNAAPPRVNLANLKRVGDPEPDRLGITCVTWREHTDGRVYPDP